MNSNVGRLFLDTTIQIERLIGPNPRRVSIERLKESAACHLPDFLADHRSKLRAVADHLAAHSNVVKDQGRVERLLAAALGDPRAALGQAACWPLGDVIIALQVPADAALWTLDPDFEPLAAVLGLQLNQVQVE